MYVFGHAGLTIAAARAADRGTDLRWAVLLALAPDIIDKPFARLFPALVQHNSRGFGHTAAFSLVVLAALLIWKRKPKPALVLWGCYAGHLLLDGMWLAPSPRVLFWPLLGPIPRPSWNRGGLWLAAWYLLGEAAGVAIIWSIVKRHGLGHAPRLAAFLKSGRLA